MAKSLPTLEDTLAFRMALEGLRDEIAALPEQDSVAIEFLSECLYPVFPDDRLGAIDSFLSEWECQIEGDAGSTPEWIAEAELRLERLRPHGTGGKTDLTLWYTFCGLTLGSILFVGIVILLLYRWQKAGDRDVDAAVLSAIKSDPRIAHQMGTAVLKHPSFQQEINRKLQRLGEQFFERPSTRDRASKTHSPIVEDSSSKDFLSRKGTLPPPKKMKNSPPEVRFAQPPPPGYPAFNIVQPNFDANSTLFELRKIGNRWEFSIASDPGLQSRAIADHDEYLKEACNWAEQIDLQVHRRIRTLSPGIARRQGSEWQILQKAQIQII
ncbi:MAG: hypothetical protein AAF998_02120 [Bacteroidota bacterium]